MGIFDIHSHVLPAVDDGSRYFLESEELLRSAYEQGITAVIATPHYINNRNRKDSSGIKKTFELLSNKTREALPKLELYLGEELFYFDGILRRLEEGRALTMNGTRYVLVEFSPSVSYLELQQAVREFVVSGYVPVLAHIERYEVLRKNDQKIDELIERGAYMQMNYGSIAGGGMTAFAAENWCRKQIANGRIHMMGSDMHRVDMRPPELERPLKWLQSKGYLELLTDINPRHMLNDEPLEFL